MKLLCGFYPVFMCFFPLLLVKHNAWILSWFISFSNPPAPDIPYKDESTKAITNNNMIDYLLELEYQFSI